LVADIDGEEVDPFHQQSQLLKQVSSDFQNHQQFQINQIVRWKPFLKNRKIPSYNAPAVVLEVFDPPIYDEAATNACSIYFKEPLSLRIGFFDDEGDFVEMYVDGSRFSPSARS
jgi:hypothetical protein